MATVSYGVVHWFDGERGFGFVTPTDSDEDSLVDVYVDSSEITGWSAAPLHAGQRVSYHAAGTRHWPTAEAVHVL